MLLAYESKAQLIVAVGTHATMVEFRDALESYLVEERILVPAAVELTRPPPVGHRRRVQVQPWRLAQALNAGPHHAGQPARLG